MRETPVLGLDGGAGLSIRRRTEASGLVRVPAGEDAGRSLAADVAVLVGASVLRDKHVYTPRLIRRANLSASGGPR